MPNCEHRTIWKIMLMICPKCRKKFEGNWCPICGTQLIREDNRLYYSNTDQSSNYDYSYIKKSNDPRKKLKIALAIICPVAVGVTVLVVLFALGIIGGESKEDKPIVSSAEDIAEENIKKLTEKANKSMQIGDYESAEELYKQIAYEDSSNDEAVNIYKILFNYNKALDYIDKKDCLEARRYFDKIPSDYSDYSIANDVDDLDNAIEECEIAYKTFNEIRTFMKDEDYENAKKCIDIIDESKLSYDDADTLDEYRNDIKDNLISESDGSRTENASEDNIE